MADLATPQDVIDLMPRALDADESARVPALLAAASAKIRLETGQDFDPVTDHVSRVRARGNKVRLPKWPVTQVKAVVEECCDGTLSAVSGWWTWDQMVHNVPDGWLRVTHDYGVAGPPHHPVLVTVTCDMVIRRLVSPEDPSLASYQIGAEQESYVRRTDSVTVTLSEDNRRDLKPFMASYGGTAWLGP